MKGWLDKYQNGGGLLDINSPKLPPTFNALTGETNSEVSSSYTFDDGTYLLPTFKYGRFLENPEDEYMKTGEFLGGPFKTVEEAESYREARHNFIDQGKQSIIPLRTKSYKDGGEISREVLFRQAVQESQLDPNAYNRKSGAKGILQLKDIAIKDYAQRNKIDPKSIDPFNVDDAMKVQDWYMNHYYDSPFVKKHGKTPEQKMSMALAIYNYGYGNVRKMVNEHGSFNIKNLPSETRNYIKAIQFGEGDVFQQKYDAAMKKSPQIRKMYIPEVEAQPVIKETKEESWLDKLTPIYEGVKAGLKLNPMFQDGGVIEDDRGQWAHPGKTTKIGSNQITMRDVPYPVLGISDTGDTQMMYPEQDYTFIGDSVTEIPLAKNGSELIKLDQLTNFTNYNTKQPGGWLDKYEG